MILAATWQTHYDTLSTVLKRVLQHFKGREKIVLDFQLQTHYNFMKDVKA